MDVNFDNMIDNLPEAVFCTDGKRYFIQVNKTMIERLGRTHQELTDMRLDDVIPAEDKHEIMKHYIKVLNGLNSSVETKFLTNVIDEYIPVELTSIYKEIDYTIEDSDKLQTSDDRGYVLTVARDITTEKKLEGEIYQKSKELERIAITDTLTGLHNRVYFDSFIEHEITKSKRYKRPLSVAKIDIDKFRIFNYKYGTHEGDNVLRELGSLVKRSVRHNVDTVYRYSGGGLMIVFPETLLKEAQIVSERLRKEFNQIEFKPMKISGDVVPVHETISIGVVLLNEDDDTASLLRKVENTLYIAKKSGGNKVSIIADE